MERKRIKLGVEIECAYNSELIELEKGNYHSTEIVHKGDNWKVERDGSLDEYGEFNEGDTAEFVSGILGGKKTFFKAIEEFKSFFNGHELSEVLSFNSSCGCHIHIGINGGKKYHNKLNYDTIKELREMFYNNVTASEILSENTKEKVKAHYTRATYVQQQSITEWNRQQTDKYTEFNRQSENNGQGLEWRSVNLRAVKNWAEFDEMFKIIYECAEYLFKKRTTTHKEKYKQVRFNRAKMSRTGTGKVILNLKAQNTSEVLQCVI
jgi:hypothetical protein